MIRKQKWDHVHRNEPRELMGVEREMGKFGHHFVGDLVKAWKILSSLYNPLLAEETVMKVNIECNIVR